MKDVVSEFYTALRTQFYNFWADQLEYLHVILLKL